MKRVRNREGCQRRSRSVDGRRNSYEKRKDSQEIIHVQIILEQVIQGYNGNVELQRIFRNN